MELEKLIIIGSGPAGLSAAIYASRGNLDPLLITGHEVGGQLTLTTDVDDFPGFPEGIQGPDLMDRMQKQAERFKARLLREQVVSVNFKTNPLEINTETKKLKAKAVIIATGASARWLGLPSEQRLIGKGVSACAVCDGFFFKDKVVAVIGGGDTAMREANYLAKICKKVIVVHRREKLRAQVALQELVKNRNNVEFIWDSEVEEVLGEPKVSGLKIKNIRTGEVKKLEVDGIFVAIGHKPNTEFLEGQMDLDNKGYVIVTNDTHTKIPGVFVGGDVSDHRYRQAVTAAGAGCKAALDAEEYLDTLDLPPDPALTRE